MVYLQLCSVVLVNTQGDIHRLIDHSLRSPRPHGFRNLDPVVPAWMSSSTCIFQTELGLEGLSDVGGTSASVRCYFSLCLYP